MAKRKDDDVPFYIAELRAHEKHLMYIYMVRLVGMLVSALSLFGGAVMTFRGLQGTFNWAVEVPHTVGAKLTNASPGIGFATIGLILGIVCIRQKPVTFRSEGVFLAAAPEPEVNPKQVLITLAVSVGLVAVGVYFALLLKK